jgi:hypothetical protein
MDIAAKRTIDAKRVVIGTASKRQLQAEIADLHPS